MSAAARPPEGGASSPGEVSAQRTEGGPASAAAGRPPPDALLARLADVLESRRGADPAHSYVARLYAKGDDAILKKIGEEATETVMAAKDGDRRRIVAETADLWFHTLVMLAHFGLRPEDVTAELARREGLSGLDEKASRREPTPRGPTAEPSGL